VAGAGFKPLDVKRATESTGLMIKFCGGKEKARLFYDRWVQQKWFCFTTGKIRKLKETVSGKILRDFDNITIVAKKA